MHKESKMKKLTLNLTELKVETFEAGIAKTASGTVKGNKDIEEPIEESVDICLMTDDDYTCHPICLAWTRKFTCVECTTPEMLC